MVQIPEEGQAAALRAVARAKRERDEAVARHDARVQAAAIDAARAGATRTRIKELAGVSSRTLYGWLAEAGLDIRPKRPAARSKRPAPPR
ncbi:hypothetical protein [Streptomyces sp. NPDC045369]|uniref:hypothetical protein n=1 Tax=Streptomyces sp. NPDC045369 TaxID=3155732 RepID=UPI0033C45A1A